MGNIKAIAGIIICAIIGLMAWNITILKSANEKLEKMNVEQTDNQKQTAEQAKFYKFTFEQMNKYIEETQGLAQIIKENKIRVDRIQSIQQQKLSYTDTIPFTKDLSPILKAINTNYNVTMPWVDTSACNPIRGTIKYIDKKLSFDIDRKEFNDTTTAIAYMKPRLWKLLWFKTRVFGKLEGEAVIKSKCGISETVNIIRVDE